MSGIVSDGAATRAMGSAHNHYDGNTRVSGTSVKSENRMQEDQLTTSRHARVVSRAPGVHVGTLPLRKQRLLVGPLWEELAREPLGRCMWRRWNEGVGVPKGGLVARGLRGPHHQPRVPITDTTLCKDCVRSLEVPLGLDQLLMSFLQTVMLNSIEALRTVVSLTVILSAWMHAVPHIS